LLRMNASDDLSMALVDTEGLVEVHIVLNYSPVWHGSWARQCLVSSQLASSSRAFQLC